MAAHGLRWEPAWPAHIETPKLRSPDLQPNRTRVTAQAESLTALGKG